MKRFVDYWLDAFQPLKPIQYTPADAEQSSNQRAFINIKFSQNLLDGPCGRNHRIRCLSLESLVCFHRYLNAFIRDKFSNFLNQLCIFPPRSKFDFANKLFGRTHKILVGD
jgi:hypothetical protein